MHRLDYVWKCSRARTRLGAGMQSNDDGYTGGTARGPNRTREDAYKAVLVGFDPSESTWFLYSYKRRWRRGEKQERRETIAGKECMDDESMMLLMTGQNAWWDADERRV